MQNEIPSTKLRSLLVAWCDDVDGAQIEPHHTSTGLSGALVWRVSHQEKTFCLKRWPREHPAADQLSLVHGLLRHVAQSAFQFAPAPVVTRTGKSFLHSDDHLWELTPWLPGETYNPNEPSLKKKLAALRCLAQFHLAASSYEVCLVDAAPGLLKRRELLRELREGELAHLGKAVGARPATELRTVAEEMVLQIQRSLPNVLGELERSTTVPLPLQWCLRDVKYDHVLFTGEQVTGLIDFGAAVVDSVAGDVARLVGSLAGEGRQESATLIDAYHACRPLSTNERKAIDSFDRGGTLAAAANWLRWLFVEERSLAPPDTVQEKLTELLNRMRAVTE